MSGPIVLRIEDLAGRMTAELIVYGPEGRRQTVALSRERITVGRLIDNDLSYPEDPGLSRHHAAFEWKQGAWYVRDLGSKNGTTLNGKRIEEARRLSAGDRILAGRVMLEFRDGEETVVYGGDESATSTTLFTDLRNALVAGERSTRLHVLLTAGRELAGDRSLDDLLGIILRLAIQAVGGARGSIEIGESGKLVTKATVGAAFEISRTVRESVIDRRTSMLVADASQDQLLSGNQSLIVQRIGSLLAVPLQTSDKVIGLIYVDSSDSFRKFTADDLNLLTVLANVAAVRIEQARLAGVEQQVHAMSADMKEAAKIQRRLLPPSVPESEGLDLCGYNQSCQGVGGDYYDFLTMSGGRLGLVVADVAGKGMAAALLMSSLHARVRILAEREDNLATLVEELNRHVRASSPGNRFITMFMMVLDPLTGKYTYSNAGHNPPIIVRESGSVERLETGGLILGILPQAKYEIAEGRMMPGDVLVIFSDGVTEAPKPGTDDEFGEPRLEDVVISHRESRATEIQKAVVQALAAWTGENGAVDDVTLVVARRPPVAHVIPSTPTGG